MEKTARTRNFLIALFVVVITGIIATSYNVIETLNTVATISEDTISPAMNSFAEGVGDGVLMISLFVILLMSVFAVAIYFVIRDINAAIWSAERIEDKAAQPQKTIVTITGASGSGKSTLEKALVAKFGYKPSVSFTTRPARPNEADGKDYHFKTEEQAQELIRGGLVIESNRFGAFTYGTLASEVDNSPAPVVMVVEPNGLKNIRDYCSSHGIKHICVVLDNDLSVLAERVLSRYSESGMTPKDVALTQERLRYLIEVESTWASDIATWQKAIAYQGDYSAETEEEVWATIASEVKGSNL